MSQASTQIGSILQEVVDGCKSQLVELKQSYASLHTKFNELDRSGAATQAKIIELEESNAGLRSEVTHLRDELSSYHTTLTGQQANHVVICEDVGATQESLDRLHDRLDAVMYWRDTINISITRFKQDSEAKINDGLHRLQEFVTKQHK